MDTAAAPILGEAVYISDRAHTEEAGTGITAPIPITLTEGRDTTNRVTRLAFGTAISTRVIKLADTTDRKALHGDITPALQL